MSFTQLKATRTDSMAKLLAAAEKLNTGGYESDESYWQPTVDKAGNGFAVIRFLPAPEGEETPWVRFWDHGFKGQTTGRWYIENSLTTLGEADPVSDFNSKLWNASADDNSPERKQARAQKRRLHYVSNIFVISDPGNPANEGKVFRFKFGKKIWDKINDLMHPQFPGDTAVNPFDFWGGANFKLKIRNVEGYRNYDKSEFDAPAAFLNGDDKALEAVYKQLYSLKDIVDPKNFKTYNELAEKLAKVLGTAVSAAPSPQTANEVCSEEAPQETAEYHVVAASSAPSAAAPPAIESADEDDGGKNLSYFARLAKS